MRDQFLVEQEGKTPDGSRGIWHDLRDEIGEGFCTCRKGVTLGEYNELHQNPDFSKPENFIRLLKIAKKKNYLWLMDSNCVVIWDVIADEDVNEFSKNGIPIEDYPSTFADLLAKALGWKEKK